MAGLFLCCYIGKIAISVLVPALKPKNEQRILDGQHKCVSTALEMARSTRQEPRAVISGAPDSYSAGERDCRTEVAPYLIISDTLCAQRPQYPCMFSTAPPVRKTGSN